MDSPLANVDAPRLRVATYNVRGCVGLDGRRSEERVAEVIASMNADAVGLQELDRGRARSKGIDQAQVIAEQLGWHCLFQPAMQHGEEHYGDAIVSRHPIRAHRVCELVGRGSWYCRETRAALWVEMQTPLGLVHLVNTHFGLGRSERLRQAQQLVSDEWLGRAPADLPLILLGDFNSLPGGRAHRTLTTRLRDMRALFSGRRHRTFPTRLPALAVDHIFINDAVHPLDLRVHQTPAARLASDHYPLVADLTRQKAQPHLVSREVEAPN